MTPKEALELANKHEVKFVDLKFIDFPGVLPHLITTWPAPADGGDVVGSRGGRTAGGDAGRSAPRWFCMPESKPFTAVFTSTGQLVRTAPMSMFSAKTLWWGQCVQNRMISRSAACIQLPAR